MTDWQAVVERHSHIVWRTAYRLLGHYADAADCFQETFLTALEISRRQRVRNWSAMLARIATCRGLDILRRRMRHADRNNYLSDPAGVPAADPGPVSAAQAAEFARELRQALAWLPAAQAEVFCLRHVNGLSYRQIAGQLEMKTSSVGVLLHRARRRLRELLEPAFAPREPEVRS